MANVLFKKGTLANLPATKVAGTIYVTTDERAMYLDTDNSTRIRLGDFQEYSNWAAIQALPASKKISTVLYYAQAENILCKWVGDASTGHWTQINPDTICQVTGVASEVKSATGGVSVETTVTDLKGSQTGDFTIVGSGATTVSKSGDNVQISSTDQSTTKAGHYTPVAENDAKLSANSSYAITGLTRDSKGHIVGIEQESFANIAAAATLQSVDMAAGSGSSANHVELETTVTVGGGGQTGSIIFEGAGATTVSHTAGTNNNPDKITITSADTQVTSVANHYTPANGTTVSASGGTTSSTSTVQVVTGITKDAAGHVTGITSGAVMQNAMDSLSYANADGTALHTITAGDGFEITAATDFGNSVSMEFDPVVTVGNGTTTDVHFVGGKATLPVYTKTQTDTAITTALGAANAMVIKGELGQANSTLPTANVEAGDTYIVTYASGLTINGQTCEAGDLFVAKQDAATSTSSNWYYVPAGNDLAYFDASAAGEGIALKTKADNITSGELKFATVSSGTAGITAEVEVATTGTFNTATVNLAMQWGEF